MQGGRHDQEIRGPTIAALMHSLPAESLLGSVAATECPGLPLPPLAPARGEMDDGRVTGV